MKNNQKISLLVVFSLLLALFVFAGVAAADDSSVVADTAATVAPTAAADASAAPTDTTAGTSAGDPDDAVVATVNGNNITVKEFREAVGFYRYLAISQYNYYVNMYKAYGYPIGDDFNSQFNYLTEAGKKDLGQSVLNNLVYYKILDKMAKDEGITVTDKEVSDGLRTAFGLNENADKTASSDTAETTATETTDDSMMDSAEIGEPETDAEKQEASDAELQNAIDSFLTQSNQNLFGEDYLKKYSYYNALDDKVFALALADQTFEEEMVHARHILVDTEDKAKEVLDKLDAGEEWDKLASEYSIDTSTKDNGGDLGWFAKGQMVKTFEDAAWALEPGEISDPVKSDYGYHIIKSEGKEANHKLEGDALKNAQNDFYNKWRSGLTDQNKIETFDIWENNIPMQPAFLPVTYTPPTAEPTSAASAEPTSDAAAGTDAAAATAVPTEASK